MCVTSKKGLNHFFECSIRAGCHRSMRNCEKPDSLSVMFTNINNQWGLELTRNVQKEELSYSEKLCECISNSVFLCIYSFKTRKGHWGLFDTVCKSLILEYTHCLMLFIIRPSYIEKNYHSIKKHLNVFFGLMTLSKLT